MPIPQLMEPPLLASKKSNGEIKFVLWLIFFPPIAALLAWRNKTWAKGLKIFLTCYALFWVISVSVSINEEPKTFITKKSDGAHEIVRFKFYVDQAISLRSEMTDLEEDIRDGGKSDDPMSRSEFRQRSFAIRDQITKLRKNFGKEFGNSINDYPGALNGSNPDLFLNTVMALGTLNSIWIDWHMIIERGAFPTHQLEYREDNLWHYINSASAEIKRKTVHVEPPS